MAAGWTLTVRAGSRVERERFGSLDEAISSVRARLEELAASARRGPAQVFRREIAPVAQVAARLELAGPRRARGGVDLRGDGSIEAWTGRVRRALVTVGAGEDAVGALGRALGPG